jgi:hypothetical protein
MTDERPEPRLLLGGLDEVLADLDTVLPTDPEAVVREFTQAGGNGGGESVALFHEWVGSLGAIDAQDVMTALRALHDDPESDSSVDLDAAMEAGWPFRPWTHGWGFRLLSLRYGFVTASYWLNAETSIPELLATSERFLAEHSASRDDHQAFLQLEQMVRLAERQQRFADARAHLERLPDTAGDRALRLMDEYKHLLAASATELADSASSPAQLLRMHVRVKELVAPIPVVRAGQRTVEQIDLGVTDAHEDRARRRTPRPPAVPPVTAGQTLEAAALALLRRLFDLSADQAMAFPSLLRRQGGGYQFGHDLSFDAAVAGNEHVRCHVECKNYSDLIRTGDIAEKLLQQKVAAATAPIDHWILISPHSDPANDLQELLRTWEETEEWGFSVQVWSPQSGVRELFSAAPDVYKALYNIDPPIVDTARVTRAFLNRIAPRLRIPRAFRAYLRDPWRMCFATEDAAHFSALVGDHVDVGAIDATGRALDGTLISGVRKWLDEPTPQALLILGEFGDGKSFFTYLLCRTLADNYLAAPGAAIYPVRLALKDLHQMGSPDALIDRWLRGIGATHAMRGCPSRRGRRSTRAHHVAEPGSRGRGGRTTQTSPRGFEARQRARGQ